MYANGRKERRIKSNEVQKRRLWSFNLEGQETLVLYSSDLFLHNSLLLNHLANRCVGATYESFKFLQQTIDNTPGRPQTMSNDR